MSRKTGGGPEHYGIVLILVQEIQQFGSVLNRPQRKVLYIPILVI